MEEVFDEVVAENVSKHYAIYLSTEEFLRIIEKAPKEA